MNYRNLKRGELIKEGDEVSHYTGTWCEVMNSIGHRVGDKSLETSTIKGDSKFRRPLKQKKPRNGKVK